MSTCVECSEGIDRKSPIVMMNREEFYHMDCFMTSTAYEPIVHKTAGIWVPLIPPDSTDDVVTDWERPKS